MNMDDFQARLLDLVREAGQKDQAMTGEEIREYLGDMQLGERELELVKRYLQAKGIRVEGAPASLPEEDAGEEAQKASDFPGTKREPDENEKRYLREYLDALEREEASYLTEALKQAALMTAEYCCEEIALPDLLQEVNLHILSAFQEEGLPEEETADGEAALADRILDGICEIVGRQMGVKNNDAALVSRVERLDQALKDLTEEGESAPAFTAAELAVILDMDLEEIRDVLRLTGDE